MNSNVNIKAINKQLKYVANKYDVGIRAIYKEDRNSPGLFTCKCNFIIGGYRIEWAHNETMFSIEIMGFDTTLSFRLGNIDPWGALVHPFDLRHGSQPIRTFTEYKYLNDPCYALWMNSQYNRQVLCNLAMISSEILIVYGMQLKAYIHPRGDTDNMLFLSNILDLIKSLPKTKAPSTSIQTIDGFEFEIRKLPPSFRTLVPLIKNWSIGDEDRRSEMINSASIRTLQKIWTLLSPHIEAIDKYVDLFEGKTANNEAIVLSWLRMAALEIEPKLDKRKRS